MNKEKSERLKATNLKQKKNLLQSVSERATLPEVKEEHHQKSFKRFWTKPASGDPGGPPYWTRFDIGKVLRSLRAATVSQA